MHHPRPRPHPLPSGAFTPPTPRPKLQRHLLHLDSASLPRPRAPVNPEPPACTRPLQKTPADWATSAARGRLLTGGGIGPSRVGGHPLAGGGIWRRPLGGRTARRTHRDPGSGQVSLDRLPVHTDGGVDSPRRPPASAQRQDLLPLLIAQDVHPGRGGPRSPPPRQRLGALPLVADFQVSISGGFCPPTEAKAVGETHERRPRAQPPRIAGFPIEPPPARSAHSLSPPVRPSTTVAQDPPRHGPHDLHDPSANARHVHNRSQRPRPAPLSAAIPPAPPLPPSPASPTSSSRAPPATASSPPSRAR